MKIIHDTHLHTEYSTDSNATVRSQIERAAALGLSGICITDHMDYCFPAMEYHDGMFEDPFIFDIDEYVKDLKGLREIIKETLIKAFPAQKSQHEVPSNATICAKSFEHEQPVGQLNLKEDFFFGTGVELGLQPLPEVVEKNKALAGRNDLDQIIGSVHLVDGKDPYRREFWDCNDPRHPVRRYFELMLENIQLFSDFDTLGHFDYLIRYAPDISFYRPSDYFDITDEIMKLIIKKDIALEINTSWMKTKGGTTNPHLEFIKRYKHLGGELFTIGSDAHSPEHMAFGFEDTSKMLEEAGIHEYVYYVNRKPVDPV